MPLKFNGIFKTGMRWYDPANGEVHLKAYMKRHQSEIEFSRDVLKSKPREIAIHAQHTPDPAGFWLNGYQADKDGRITFATGTKDRFVISKNLIDFWFCSTNQSFTSCFRLTNGCMQRDLKRLQETPGIYIVYTTQEDGEYAFNNCIYTHPKMSGRAFLFESPDHTKYTCGRPYGKTGFEIRDTLRHWLPNGLDVGWDLSESQKQVQDVQYDNFSDGKTCHDAFDEIFNDNELYKDGLNIKIKEKKDV